MILLPKTEAGERTLALPPQAVEALSSLKEQRRGDPWVFTNDDGEPLPQSSVQKRMKQLCEELGLPTIGAHGLRHMHATLLLSGGLPVPAVSARLGHADPQVTMRIYAHALGRDDRQAAEVISRVL